jgi:hypothetical protein
MALVSTEAARLSSLVKYVNDPASNYNYDVFSVAVTNTDVIKMGTCIASTGQAVAAAGGANVVGVVLEVYDDKGFKVDSVTGDGTKTYKYLALTRGDAILGVQVASNGDLSNLFTASGAVVLNANKAAFITALTGKGILVGDAK